MSYYDELLDFDENSPAAVYQGTYTAQRTTKHLDSVYAWTDLRHDEGLATTHEWHRNRAQVMGWSPISPSYASARLHN